MKGEAVVRCSQLYPRACKALLTEHLSHGGRVGTQGCFRPDLSVLRLPLKLTFHIGPKLLFSQESLGGPGHHASQAPSSVRKPLCQGGM